MQSKYIIFLIVTFFTFSSLVPYYRHGTICINTNYTASEYYINKTHQFLKHLKVKNPEQIPVRLIVNYPIFLSEKEASPPYTLGSTNQNGIWLNEKALEEGSPERRFFVIAHEAAHYALKHSENLYKLYKNLTWLNYIVSSLVACASILYQKESSIEAKLPSIFKENKQLKLLVKGIKTTLFSGLSYLTFIYLKKNEIENAHLKFEQKADKIATYLLCDLGHESLVEKVLAFLYEEIKAGNGKYTDGEHPTTEQSYEYIKKYLNRWKTKYASRPNASYIKI